MIRGVNRKHALKMCFGFERLNYALTIMKYAHFVYNVYSMLFDDISRTINVIETYLNDIVSQMH